MWLNGENKSAYGSNLESKSSSAIRIQPNIRFPKIAETLKTEILSSSTSEWYSEMIYMVYLDDQMQDQDKTLVVLALFLHVRSWSCNLD